MAVFRIEKTKDFTIMSNHHLRNIKLSLKAKGLLSLMLSLPEDWDYTTKGLAYICKDGIDSIATALKELEQHGYLTRRRLRNENGQLGDIEYAIHEQPTLPDEEGVSPKRENPRQEKPEQAEPEQENPPQLNTNRSITEKSKTDISSTHQSIRPHRKRRAVRMGLIGSKQREYNVLQCLVRCGVIHQLAVVLGKYPVIPLPVVAHIEAVLQLFGVQLPEAFCQRMWY